MTLKVEDHGHGTCPTVCRKETTQHPTYSQHVISYNARPISYPRISHSNHPRLKILVMHTYMLNTAFT